MNTKSIGIAVAIAAMVVVVGATVGARNEGRGTRAENPVADPAIRAELVRRQAASAQAVRDAATIRLAQCDDAVERAQKAGAIGEVRRLGENEGHVAVRFPFRMLKFEEKDALAQEISCSLARGPGRCVDLTFRSPYTNKAEAAYVGCRLRME